MVLDLMVTRIKLSFSHNGHNHSHAQEIKQGTKFNIISYADYGDSCTKQLPYYSVTVE